MDLEVWANHQHLSRLVWYKESMFNQGFARRKSQKSRKTLCRPAPTHPAWSKCPQHCPTSLSSKEKRSSAKWASVSTNTNTNTLGAKHNVQTNLFLQLSQKAPILWIIVQQETILYAYNNSNNNNNKTHVLWSQGVHCLRSARCCIFAKTWKPKMSKFSSFKPLFSKLAEKQSRNFLQLAESLKHQCLAWGFTKTSQIGFGAVLDDPYFKARTLYYQ